MHGAHGAHGSAGQQTPAQALAARRALVRRDTVPVANRAAAQKAAARLRTGPGRHPLTRKSAAAAQVSAYLDYALLTGPGNGTIISCNGSVCAQPGDVSPSEPLSIWEEIGVVNGSATGSYQVTFSWTESCGGSTAKTFGSQTVTVGPSLWYPASGTPFDATASCTGASAGSLPNYDLTINMSVAGGASTSATVDANWLSEPKGQLLACPGSPDSAGTTSAQGSCGDPVDTASGTYADTFTDAALQTAGWPLSVIRSYSSADTASGAMGPGWSLPWQASLSISSTTGNATFTAENGDTYLYTSSGGGAFTAPPGARSVLAAVTGSSGSITGYTLTAPDHHVLDFSAAGQLTAEKDATGRGLGFTDNSSGQVASITDASGQTISLAYTSGLLTQVTLPAGHTIGYAYTGGRLTSVTDPDGHVTTYAYSPAGLLASIQDPDGNDTVRNTYNSSGQVTSQEDGAGNVTSFSFTTTSGGLPETDVTDPDGGITSDVYSGGTLVQSTDPLGNTTSYVYNQFFQPIQVTDALGNITTTTYDSAGHLTSQTDPVGNEQQWTYDSSGNMVSHTDGDGNETVATYNAMDEVTAQTSAAGGKTTYSYDAGGNLTSTVEPRGNVSGANAAAYTTTYAYNAAGQLTSVINPDGGKTSDSYDAMGYPLTVTDPMNRETTYGYDNDERQTSVTAPGGGVTKSSYDAAGNLVTRTDPDGNAYSYAYNADNRVIKATDPLGNAASYGYDGDGNQVTFTDARGIKTSTTFDADDRPTKITYSDGTPTVSYAYDADGHTTSVTDATGTRTMSYDADGELLSAAGPGSGSFSYQYDGDGNVTSRTYPNGIQASYTYTAGGQISALTSGSATTTYSYDPAGDLISTAEPNGVTESRTYDDAGQLTNIKDATSSSTLDSYGLTLNADGQPSQAAITQDATAQPTEYYGYDGAGQLASACGSSSGSSACSAVSAGTATGSAPNPGTAGPPSGAVTNGEPGICMDDTGDSTSNGNKVQIWTCNGEASQQWTVESNGTIEIGGSCLDVKGAGTTNGTLIDLYTCNGGANQQWKPGSSSSLVNPVSGMCLSDPNASTTNGTQLIIAPCNGQTQQKWRLPASGLAPAGALTSGVSGKCLDDTGSSTANGNKVQLWTCNNGTGQNWTVAGNGTVQFLGKCLDIKGAGTTNGTLIDLYTCNGGSNQVWIPGPSGYLVNPASGKCLDDPGSSTTNGTQLDLYTCNGGSNQVWTLPSTTVPATPTGLSVTAGAGSATLSWTPPASSGGSALTGYTVTASPGGATGTAGPYATTATVAGLIPGTAYTFTLTASNGAGSATTTATSAVTPGNETTWSYDQAGNITSTEADGLTTTSTYNTDEELIQAATAGGTTTSYGYDADGDQTTGGNQTYTYSGAGKLAKAVTPAGTFAYTYDAGGNLSATSLNGSALQGTVWDENSMLPNAVEDTSASGATAADYLYGPGGTLTSVTTAAGTSDPTVDWLGSVTGLVNSAGSQVASTVYSAYGTPSTSGSLSTAADAIGYAGSYALPGGNGLDDMRARDYSPSAVAFTSVDPDIIQTGQPYAYAAGEPVALSDPTGLSSWGLCLSGTATGGIGGTGSVCEVIAFDPFTGELQIGSTETGGFAIGIPSAGAGIGLQRSNADQISELGGPFGYAGGSIGPGVSGTGELFVGDGPCNNTIVGGMVGAGVGVSAAGAFEIHGGVTETATQVSGSVNVYQLLANAGSSLSNFILSHAGW